MHMANVLVCGTKSGRVGVAKNALLFGRMISPSFVIFPARTWQSSKYSSSGVSVFIRISHHYDNKDWLSDWLNTSWVF